MTLRKKLLLGFFVLVVYALHQDSWNWTRVEPLLFGFLPAGLTFHTVYTVLASVMMAILVRWAWPKHLENVEPVQKNPSDTQGHQ